MELYGGFSDYEIQQLTEDARVSRRQRWWTAPEYREHLTSGLMQLLQFEAEATAIRAYQPVLVPGPLQTSSFAETVLAWWSEHLSDEDRRVRHDVRMMRRAQLIEREDAPMYLLILDQSALEREIGGPKVMAEQLESLIESSRRPNVRVRIVPYAEGALIGGTFGPFVVLDLAEDDPEDAVVYRENYNTDNVLHDRKDVRFHRDIFETLWKRSWSEELSLRAINAKASELRFQVDISRST